MRMAEKPSLVIPKIIHFIWAGGVTPVNDSDMLTIARWAIGNPTFELNLWLDENTSNLSFTNLKALYQEKFAKAYRTVCQHEGKSVEHVPEVFFVRDIRKDKICADHDEIVDYELDRIDPNYGASSDVLRYRILYNIGGVYVDCDVRNSETPLIRLPEFFECAEHVLYIDHLSQVRRDQLNTDILSSFPGFQDRLGNDAFICTVKNPLMHECIKHVEEVNYQLARLYGATKEQSILQKIVETAYNSHNIKDTTISRTGPQAVREVINDVRLGELRTNKTLTRKLISPEPVLLKTMKSQNYLLVEPVVEIKPVTSFKSPNRSSWLNVNLNTNRFDSLELVFKNLIRTIEFEQKHFGVLRLADHLRIIRMAAKIFADHPEEACSQFIAMLSESNLVQRDRLFCVQMISNDLHVQKFYQKCNLLDLTQLTNPLFCDLIFDSATSIKSFTTNLFSDEILTKYSKSLWCNMIEESMVLKESKGIVDKIIMGTEFIQMLLAHPSIYCGHYPLENQKSILNRYLKILDMFEPLVDKLQLQDEVNIVKSKINDAMGRIDSVLAAKQLFMNVNEIAKGLYRKRHFEKAMERWLQELPQLEKVLGNESSEVATLYNNIAMALCDLNRHAEALPYLEDSLRIRSKIFGESDDLTTKTAQRLSSLKQELKADSENNKK